MTAEERWGSTWTKREPHKTTKNGNRDKKPVFPYGRQGLENCKRGGREKNISVAEMGLDTPPLLGKFDPKGELWRAATEGGGRKLGGHEEERPEEKEK